jgi:hypothetical protein
MSGAANIAGDIIVKLFRFADIQLSISLLVYFDEHLASRSNTGEDNQDRPLGLTGIVSLHSLSLTHLKR